MAMDDKIISLVKSLEDAIHRNVYNHEERKYMKCCVIALLKEIIKVIEKAEGEK